MKRSTFLLSLALTGPLPSTDWRDFIRQIGDRLSRAFEFWEIIVVLDEQNVNFPGGANWLREFPNVRLIVVKEQTNSHRLRTVAAQEAIGDIVVLSTPREALSLDLVSLAIQSLDLGEVTVYSKPGSGLLHAPQVWLLSKLSGFHVEPNDLKTIAFPRVVLNDILGSDTADLELRFDPLSTRRPRRRISLKPGSGAPVKERNYSQRFWLLTDLMIVSTPRVLLTVALMSAILTVLANVYMTYAIAVFLTQKDVVAGWLTTSLAVGGLSAFIGATFFGLSLGMAGLYDRLRGGARSARVEEFGNTDFFAGGRFENVAGISDDSRPAAARERKAV